MKEVITISKRFLLLPYAPSFLFLVIALCDRSFFNQYLLSVLPTTTKSLFLYYVFFEFPHIVASFFMFAEKEYRVAYKEAVYKKLITITILGAALLLVSQTTFYVIMIGYTLYHVVKQQLGIAKFYGAAQSVLLNGVLASSVLVGSIAFLSTMTPMSSVTLQGTSLLGLLTVLIFILHGQEERKNIYLLLFMLSFASSAFLFGTGYILLGLLSMRIVHDITAFIFYGVHNHNRKKDGRNALFTIPFLANISPLFLTIIYALIINLFYIFLVHLFIKNALVSFVLMGTYYMVSVAHYFVESKMWKRGTLSRNYIHIT